MVKTDSESGLGAEDIGDGHLFKVTGLSSSNLQKLAQTPETPASDFEAAIEATGYGRFNVILMVCAVPAFWSAISVTSSVSYIYPRAQCHMQLTLIEMGALSAITYSGMIASAMIWGFLSDTLGRRRIMTYGFLAAGLVEVTAALSQSFVMLLVTRFFCGFLFNGPFAVLISYIAELHRAELRSRVILLTSLFYTLGNASLPLLAWATLTIDYNWSAEIFGRTFDIRSWNLFLLTTALMPLLAGSAFYFMPESPKFLMSRGRNEEALQVFLDIYTKNTGETPDNFPIKVLVEEKSECQGKGFAALRGGFRQLAPLFKMPFGPRLLLICAIHMGCMFGSNAIRLWYPQLAALINSGTKQGLCSAISQSSKPMDMDLCKMIETDYSTYLQSVIAGSGSIITYTLGGILVNKCGNRTVAGFCDISAGVMTVLLPLFGVSPVTVMTIVTTLLAMTALAQAAMSSITVESFPTSLRVMAMATFLMCGRIGTITGTLTFPALVHYGCLPPFAVITTVLCVCGSACFLLPNTTMNKLK